jgi:DNA-binding transcriptional regulator YiaG
MVDLSTGQDFAASLKWPKDRPFIEPERFYLARCNACFTQAQAAAELGVTARTIRNWESGRAPIPYAAFRLLRLLSGHKLPGAHWRGFTVRGGVLWTPEQKPLYAWEMRWLSLTFSIVRYWLREHGYSQHLPAKQMRERLQPVQGRVRRRTTAPLVELPQVDRGLPGPPPLSAPSRRAPDAQRPPLARAA